MVSNNDVTIQINVIPQPTLSLSSLNYGCIERPVNVNGVQSKQLLNASQESMDTLTGYQNSLQETRRVSQENGVVSGQTCSLSLRPSTVASSTNVSPVIPNQESESDTDDGRLTRPLSSSFQEEYMIRQREDTLVSQEILKAIRLQQKQINVLINGGYGGRQENSNILNEVLSLSTVEKYREFEESLNNEDRQEQLVTVICGLGGRTVKDAVARTMGKIFRNIVAKEINCEGRVRGSTQKFKFSDSNIKTALFRAIKLARNLRSSTEEETETAVKNWLRHAPARFKLEDLPRPRRRR